MPKPYTVVRVEIQRRRDPWVPVSTDPRACARRRRIEDIQEQALLDREAAADRLDYRPSPPTAR
jgi:hypothetical protein